MEKVLITGITGFVGSHLAELLLGEGFDVYGMARWRSRTENIDHILDKITIVDADLRDSHSLKLLMKKVEPDVVFHLAAQSSVETSWKSPAKTFDVNVVGTVNLVEVIRESNLDPKIHISGSSEEYGLVNEDEIPVKETNELRPMSPYAVSTVAKDFVGYQYHASYGMKIIRTRAFNHTGPRRGEIFVCSNFAKQIAEIEKKTREPVISVGNLTARRDFTDVRDMVKAYYLAIQKCDFGEVYNICCGKAVEIQEVLDTLLGFSKTDVEVKNDPDRMRPSDIKIIVGDSTKFRSKTGWKPEFSLEKTLEDLLNYWRSRV